MAHASQPQIPVVSVHSAGFCSYFQFSLPGPFSIVDTHPEVDKTTDLRLLQPWPELSAFAKDMVKDIDNLDDHDHGHLPYVVILLHFLERWRELHDGKNPITYKEKLDFARFVEGGSRTNNTEGGEENFQEAVDAINKNVKVTELEAGLREVFDHQATSEVRPILQYHAQRIPTERVRKMIDPSPILILAHCEGDQSLLSEAWLPTTPRIFAGHEGKVECIRQAAELVQRKGSERCAGGPRLGPGRSWWRKC